MFRKNNEVEAVEVAPGAVRRILSYNEDLMICEFHLTKGAVVAAHAHPHVQATYVASGKISYTKGEETQELNAGDTALAAGGVVHAVVALEDSVVIDAFTPMREDFIQ